MLDHLDFYTLYPLGRSLDSQPSNMLSKLTDLLYSGDKYWYSHLRNITRICMSMQPNQPDNLSIDGVRGKFVTRFVKALKNDGINLDSDQKTQLGIWYEQYISSELKEYYFDIAPEIDWSGKDEAFGSYGTCWFKGCGHTKTYYQGRKSFERMMPHSALAIRFFTHESNYPNLYTHYHRYSDQSMLDLGRMWCIKNVPEDGDIVIFNYYARGSLGEDSFMDLLSRYLGVKYYHIYLKLNMAIYINSGSSRLLTKREDYIQTEYFDPSWGGEHAEDYFDHTYRPIAKMVPLPDKLGRWTTPKKLNENYVPLFNSERLIQRQLASSIQFYNQESRVWVHRDEIYHPYLTYAASGKYRLCESCRKYFERTGRKYCPDCLTKIDTTIEPVFNNYGEEV